MKKTGNDIRIQHFSCWRSDIPALIIILVFALISYLLFLPEPRISFVLASIVFITFQMETYSWAVVSRLLPRTKAANIIQIIPPKGKKHVPCKKRVVITANYDSSRTSPFAIGLIPRLYRIAYILLFLCILGIAVVSLIGISGRLAKFSPATIRLIWYASSPFAAYVFLFLLILSWGEIFGRNSQGANDNASGIGTMLSLLEDLAQSPLENTEIWCVATARGFAGGRGTVELIKKNKKLLKNAYFLNIDHTGCGEIRLLKREGPIFGFGPKRRLKRICKEAINSLGLNTGFGSCRVKKSDAMVAQARGINAITIAGTSGSAYPGWRSRYDTYDRIKQSSLEMAKIIAHAIIKKIDAS